MGNHYQSLYRAARQPGLPSAADRIEPLSHPIWTEDQPDTIHELRRGDGGLIARCSTWGRTDGSLAGSFGVIGHYAAAQGGAGAELLEQVCAYLTRQGATRALGPMDGNTWRGYRLVTSRGQAPAFFMEPNHPDHYLSDWLSAGFVMDAEYLSARCDDLTIRDPRLRRVQERLERIGVNVRPVDVERFDEELAAIHRLSIRAFQGNYLYSPIDLKTFARMYRDIAPRIEADLVLLAERGGRLVGYVFAIAELNQAARGLAVDTVIVKTIAVEPGRDYAGLGIVLLEQVQHNAYRLGYRRAIHALMHADNVSLRLSGHYAQPIRRYALFARELNR
jgi:L-amino acid N-acyltransferase YncA